MTKESDLNYPLPPNVFKMIEFMEVQDDYRKFVQWKWIKLKEKENDKKSLKIYVINIFCSNELIFI